MTYTVSSGTLNPSIPYHTIPYFLPYYNPVLVTSINFTSLLILEKQETFEKTFHELFLQTCSRR